MPGLVANALLAALCALCGCTSREASGLPSSDSVLEGTWQIELRGTRGSAAGRRIEGEVHLRHHPTERASCRTEDTLTCRTHVAGHHELPIRSLLSHDLAATVSAALVGRESLMLMIGLCCDRGEIGMSARWMGDRFRGRWIQENVGLSGIGGVVTLERVSSHASEQP